MAMRIANVVFDAPGSTLEVYGEKAGAVAGLYAELLGMRLRSRADFYREAEYPADAGDEVDPLVMAEEPERPNIAFEREQAEYRAPTWPDPEHPQQMHLDIAVADLDAADEVVSRHGAVLLVETGDHRTYADAVGHPFCLYSGTDATGRIARIVVDCFSPRALAAFYGELLDMPVRIVDTPERVELGRPAAVKSETGPTLAFQHVVAPPPRWPDPAFPQQLHLDLVADEDLAVARARAERLGAIRLPYLGGGEVYADPAGHPFCLCD